MQVNELVAAHVWRLCWHPRDLALRPTVASLDPTARACGERGKAATQQPLIKSARVQQGLGSLTFPGT